MIKVLTAALVGTLAGIAVMVIVIGATGADTEGSSSVGLGPLPVSTATPPGGTSEPPATEPPATEPPATEPGDGGSGDPASGETLFAANCASCHVVEPGAAPTVGPNLADEAASLDESAIIDKIAEGGSVMPAGLVSGQDAADVAAYILSLAQ